MTATTTATRSSNGRRTATPPSRSAAPRLSQRGKGAVAVSVAGLVLIAGHGHAGPATLAGVALYVLVTGRASAVAALIPSARQALRVLAWAVVALAALTALHGSTAPGGPLLGLALATSLGTYLKLTATGSRRRRS